MGQQCFLRCLQAPGNSEEAAKRRVRKSVFFISIRGGSMGAGPSRMRIGRSPNYETTRKIFHRGTKKRPPGEAVVSLKSIWNNRLLGASATAFCLGATAAASAVTSCGAGVCEKGSCRKCENDENTLHNINIGSLLIGIKLRTCENTACNRVQLRL